jgi:hypothetical protein
VLPPAPAARGAAPAPLLLLLRPFLAGCWPRLASTSGGGGELSTANADTRLPLLLALPPLPLLRADALRASVAGA